MSSLTTMMAVAPCDGRLRLRTTSSLISIRGEAKRWVIAGERVNYPSMLAELTPVATGDLVTIFDASVSSTTSGWAS